MGGIAIEASAFSPHRSTLADFTQRGGPELIARYPFIADAPTWSRGVEWVPLHHARALPGGPVLAEAYAALKSEILERAVAAGPLDGVLLDIHGAMTVIGCEDAEADLAEALRAALGEGVMISASMDLHGNVSRRLAEVVDLLTCYRTAPHVDEEETRERAARNLVAQLRQGERARKAWVSVPLLLPGERTSTRVEPAKGLYAMVREVAGHDGILDASFFVGYAWGDEARCRAAVVVMGKDVETVGAKAARLAQAAWAARHDFGFAAWAGSLDACLERAMVSASRPFFISDSGDNPTAGGAGDVTFSLARLLATPELVRGTRRVVYASMLDPEAVAAAAAAGVGAAVRVGLGAKLLPTPAPPVALEGTVTCLRPNDPVGGDLAVIGVGGIEVIVTSRRKPYHKVADFSELGIDPRERDIVVVKIGYLEPELHAIAADWCLALTPGGVDQDLARLGHRHLARPLFPLEGADFDPDLTPVCW
ncbi:MAG: M81 family metallopeptidase [Actinomycetota bacterium]|nr:M81 family metallopeptidase [Actinomycetota bacterium]